MEDTAVIVVHIVGSPEVARVVDSTIVVVCHRCTHTDTYYLVILGLQAEQSYDFGAKSINISGVVALTRIGCHNDNRVGAYISISVHDSDFGTGSANIDSD